MLLLCVMARVETTPSLPNGRGCRAATAEILAGLGIVHQTSERPLGAGDLKGRRRDPAGTQLAPPARRTTPVHDAAAAIWPRRRVPQSPRRMSHGLPVCGMTRSRVDVGRGLSGSTALPMARLAVRKASCAMTGPPVRRIRRRARGGGPGLGHRALNCRRAAAAYLQGCRRWPPYCRAPATWAVPPLPRASQRRAAAATAGRRRPTRGGTLRAAVARHPGAYPAGHRCLLMAGPDAARCPPSSGRAVVLAPGCVLQLLLGRGTRPHAASPVPPAAPVLPPDRRAHRWAAYRVRPPAAVRPRVPP